MSWLLLRIVATVSFIGTLTLNALANILPINGIQTGAMSDSFPVLIVPAAYVFSIWALIYLGLIVYTVTLWTWRESPLRRRVAIWFALSNLANSLWIVAFHYYSFVLATVLLLAVFVCLAMAYVHFRGVLPGSTQVAFLTPNNWSDRFLQNLPFQIYFGWVTVALGAQISQLLVWAQWDGFGVPPEIWTAVVLGALVLVSLAMSIRFTDLPHLLVQVWAFIGIAIKEPTADLARPPLVAIAAWVGIALMVVGFVVSLVRTQLSGKRLRLI